MVDRTDDYIGQIAREVKGRLRGLYRVVQKLPAVRVASKAQ